MGSGGVGVRHGEVRCAAREFCSTRCVIVTFATRASREIGNFLALIRVRGEIDG